MKKFVSVVLCLVLFASCITGLAACGKNNDAQAASVSEVGMWDAANILMWSPTTPCANYEVITLFSDNTFHLTTCLLCYYTPDNGETYVQSFDFFATVRGKYETVSEDKELGEKTIKLTEITEIATRDTDSKQDSTLAEKLKDNPAVGRELVLGMDHKISEQIGVGNFIDLPEG